MADETTSLGQGISKIYSGNTPYSLIDIGARTQIKDLNIELTDLINSSINGLTEDSGAIGQRLKAVEDGLLAFKNTIVIPSVESGDTVGLIWLDNND